MAEITYNYNDGENGIKKAIITTSGQLITSNGDLEIAKGTIDGVYCVNKFGKNPDIDTGTVPEDVWDAGGIYVPPTTDRIHQIQSSSNQDIGILRSTGTITSNETTTLVDTTADFITDGVIAGDIVLDDTSQDHSIVVSVTATVLTIKPWHHSTESYAGNTYRIVGTGGTGAAVLHIKQGYMVDGSSNTEFVILNGTTIVNTVYEYYRITRAHIHGAGSNNSNVGTISLLAVTDGTITAQINPNNGQTQMAFYHVPDGKTGFITSYYGSIYRVGAASTAMGEMEIRTRLWGNSGDGENLFHSLAVNWGSVSTKVFNPYMKISSGSDVWIRVNDVSDNDTIFSAGFDIIIIDNDKLH